MFPLKIFCVIGLISVARSVQSLSVSKYETKVIELKNRIGVLKNQLAEGNVETVKSEDYKSILQNINFNSFRNQAQDDIADVLDCFLCQSVVTDFLNLRRISLRNQKQLRNLAIELCTDLEIQSEEVCTGIIDLNVPIITHIIDNRKELTSDVICSVIMSDKECVNSANENKLYFEVEISNSSNVQMESKQAHQSLKKSVPLNIVHITDIHVDYKYMKKAFADCEEPLCCHEIDSENEEDPKAQAGNWGDYRSCDTPWSAVVDAFQQIKRQHPKIDAIYFTGDIVDHGIWSTSIDENKVSISKINQLFAEVFENVPVYPVLGNHESHPSNIFAPSDILLPSLSSQWLYDHSAIEWQKWLPNNTLETIKLGGYYTTLIQPGLRVIALNNNICLSYNFWILYSTDEMKRQFQWLHDTLLAAEQAEEYVHILAHIPSGNNDYFYPCSREYKKIVERFYKTISAQFNGHSEFYGINVFYDSSNKSIATNVAWNGGSLATYSEVNRNYVLYEVEAESFEVINVESWIYNLTEANENDSKSPNWFKQFSLKDIFELDDLSPATMTQFVDQLAGNKTKLQQYWEYKVKGSDLIMKEGCSIDCLKGVLCNMITDVSNDDKCQAVKKLFDMA